MSSINNELKQYRSFFHDELYKNILPYWMKYGVEKNGHGFFGAVDLNEVYEPSFQHAVEMIKQNGGKQEGDMIMIQYQEPQTVPLEIDFEGLFPTKRKRLNGPLSQNNPEISFEMEGCGFVVTGQAIKDDQLSDLTLELDVFVDGRFLETVKMLTQYRTPEYIIHQLIDIVSKNGNLLLNVPLKSDGSLDKVAADLLHEVGKWMKVNGEGIYGSRPFIHFNGLPAWSPDDDFTNIDQSTAENLRFTTRGDTISVFTGGIPEERVVLRPLNKAIYPEFSSVEMLGVNDKLKFVQDNEALKIEMPATYPSNYSICLKIY